VTRLVGRTGRYALALTAAALVLAACGGGDGITIGDPSPGTGAPTTTAAPATSDPGAPSATAAPPTTPEQTTPSTDRCHTSEVSVAFGPEDAGAGSRMSTVILTNTSTRTCTVYGYGGLQLLDAGKHALPNGLTREASPAPVLLRVAPGGKVYKDFRFGVVPSGSEKCPAPAYVRITPPDETDNRLVPWTLGTVCGDVLGRSYQRTSTEIS
jgi:Protein of unknown function (DUF4232)